MNQDRQKQIRQLLDQQLEQLDDNHDITSRIQQARGVALKHYSESSWISNHKPQIAWALAASLIMAIILPRWLTETGNDVLMQSDMSFADIELLSEYEMLEQDMEFYFWLETIDVHSG